MVETLAVANPTAVALKKITNKSKMRLSICKNARSIENRTLREKSIVNSSTLLAPNTLKCLFGKKLKIYEFTLFQSLTQNF